jgi:hypothetical protein
MQRFSEMGGMMIKMFVSAAVTAALCSLAISVAPAFGQDSEFASESATVTTTTSSTAQIIRLGTSGWVECPEITMKSSPTLGASTTLKLKIETYTGCVYNHNLKSEPTTPETKCPIVLESADLEELFANEFAEGLAKFHCTLKITGIGGCKIAIEEPTTALPEYAWTNTDTTSGHYKSLLKLRLEKLQYSFSSGCGSSGTNGEWNGSIPIEHVIVLATL